MQNLLIASAFAALTLSLAPPIVAADSDTQVPIHGTVVSVNRADGTVVVRYAQPGSQPATKHTFSLTNHNDALRLHPGAVIDGTADMSRKTWALSNVNIESDKPLKGQIGP